MAVSKSISETGVVEMPVFVYVASQAIVTKSCQRVKLSYSNAPSWYAHKGKSRYTSYQLTTFTYISLAGMSNVVIPLAAHVRAVSQRRRASLVYIIIILLL